MIDYHKTMGLGRKILDKHGLADWTFDVVNLSNPFMFGALCELDLGLDCGEFVLGYCDHNKRTIYVDRSAPMRRVRQIILHEIAHTLTPGEGHNRRWWNKASDIGVTFAELLPYIHGLKQGEK